MILINERGYRNEQFIPISLRANIYRTDIRVILKTVPTLN